MAQKSAKRPEKLGFLLFEARKINQDFLLIRLTLGNPNSQIALMTLVV